MQDSPRKYICSQLHIDLLYSTVNLYCSLDITMRFIIFIYFYIWGFGCPFKHLEFNYIIQVCSIIIFPQISKMVKCTPDLIECAGQYINPIRDRELDLRGYKIPVIENLGSTLDQFDTIDFSDNEIRKLDGFPFLSRVKTLLMNNNRIVRISEGKSYLPVVMQLFPDCFYKCILWWGILYPTITPNY